MFEREYRDLASVTRWPIIPHNRKQSVAEHSYFVALYCSHILEAVGCGSEHLWTVTLRHALEHDRSECYTSDIPGPVKRATDTGALEMYEEHMDAVRFSTEKGGKTGSFALAVRKLADIMDEYAFWSEENMLGNARASSMMLQLRPIMSHKGEVLQEVVRTCSYCRNCQVEEEIIIPFISALNKPKVLPSEE